MIKIEKNIKKKYGGESRISINHDDFNETKLTSRGAFLVIQMHDELIYDVNQQDVNDVKQLIKDCMENCIEFKVKMKVKMKIGYNWGNLNPV
jgi:DNA polymerase I-like protein with 3'-5' exonuclease and polymerase domains